MTPPAPAYFWAGDAVFQTLRAYARFAVTRWRLRPGGIGSDGPGLVQVARHPVKRANGALQVGGRGWRRADREIVQEAVQPR